MFSADEMCTISHVELIGFMLAFVNAKLYCKQKDGDSDATFAESVRKRQAERAKALSIDEMVRAVPPTLSRANVQYELFAVCHHAGSIKAGHYYAYVKGAKAPAKGLCHGTCVCVDHIDCFVCNVKACISRGAVPTRHRWWK